MSTKSRVVRVRDAELSLGFALSDPAEAVLAVRSGLPMTSFENLQTRLGVSTHVLTEIVRIAPRTLARRKREGRLNTDESERLWRVGALLDRATLVLCSVEQARRWFLSPNRALGNVSPLAYADTEPGAKEVENLLGRIEHGVFS